MAKAKFVRLVIPRSKVVASFKEKKGHTRHVMTSDGLMNGRRVVPANRSDRTGFLRVKSPIDVNKDGDTNDKVDLQKGEIIGRLPRGTTAKPKRITVRRHWSGGSVVRTHKRKVR